MYTCVLTWGRVPEEAVRPAAGSFLKIHQRGVQWKQGVVVYIIL